MTDTENKVNQYVINSGKCIEAYEQAIAELLDQKKTQRLTIEQFDNVINIQPIKCDTFEQSKSIKLPTQQEEMLMMEMEDTRARSYELAW